MYSGLVNSGALNAAQKKPSFADMLTRLQPNGASPLFLLLNKGRKKTAKQIVHGYWTESFPFVSMNISVAVADGVATTFTVTSTADVIPGMMFRNETTGEVVRVETVASGTSITVTRGVGNVAAAAMALNSKLYPVGTAYEEGSTRPTAQRLQQSLTNNNTQIFRNAWGITGTAMAEEYYQEAGGSPLGKDKVDGALLHATDIERAIIWGQKFAGTKNGQPFHTMDGIESVLRQYANANISTAGATTNYDQLEGFLDLSQTTVTAGSTNERLLLCGNNAYKVLNGIGRKSGQYQIVQGQTDFGLRFESFKTSLGTYHMLIHPLLNQTAEWSKMAIAVDLPSMALAYLSGRDTQHKGYGMNGEISTDNSIDAVGGVYTSELTTEITNPAAFAIVKNLTAAA